MKPQVLLLVAGLVLSAAVLGRVTASEEAPPSVKNPVVFWELACHDADKSSDFFRNVFEWDIQMIPDTIIHGCKTSTEDKGIDGGIFTLQNAKLPFVAIYISVTEIEKKAELVRANGGLVHEEPHEIFPGTWICLFNDPSGVTFAMLEHRPTEK